MRRRTWDSRRIEVANCFRDDRVPSAIMGMSLSSSDSIKGSPPVRETHGYAVSMTRWVELVLKRSFTHLARTPPFYCPFLSWDSGRYSGTLSVSPLQIR